MPQFYLPNTSATFEVAAKLALDIKPGQVVYLHGGLGAGKTTLVQGLLKAWGYEGSVTSPTFTLVEPYSLANFTVFHFDLYRLKNPAEIEFIGIKDYFLPTSICLIEWPENAAGFLPKPDWELNLHYDGEGRILNFHNVCCD